MTAAPDHGRNPTITDVAHRAGVSTATVSKVLNSRWGVAEATSRRVQQAIDGLGYEPSLAARHLRGTTTDRMIGVLYSHLGPWEGEVLKGVAEEADGSCHRLLTFSAADRRSGAGWEHRALARLGGSLIDGAILVAPTDHAAAGSLPTVAIMPQGRAAGLDVIRSDERGAGELATAHLVELGHRRIAYLGRADGLHPSLHEVGHRDALRRAGIELDRDLVRYEATPDAAARAVYALLGLADPPTAVVAGDDELALAVHTVAGGAQRLSVVGSGGSAGTADAASTALAAAGLTTLSQRPHEMGRAAFVTLRAAVRLRAVIGSGAPEPREVLVPAELVVRSSTWPPVLRGPGRRA
ncbi:LacI family DNA-binding transcriptional regulator [Cellulomonas hominis]